MTSGEFFVQAILGTINNYLIHAGATQNTAELLAGVQKYDKDYDIMSLRKPYRGKKPTALFITKYGLLNRKNNQDVFRIIPYTDTLKKLKKHIESNVEEIKENDQIINKPDNNINNSSDHYIVPIEELDLSLPIDHIEDYL